MSSCLTQPEAEAPLRSCRKQRDGRSPTKQLSDRSLPPRMETPRYEPRKIHEPPAIPVFPDHHREIQSLAALPSRLHVPAKFIPVVFLLSTILLLYLIYVLSHGLKLLQLHTPRGQRNEEMRQRGIVQLAMFHVITFLLVTSYIRCILTSPGTIPGSQGEFTDLEAKGQITLPTELKRSGQPRHCKWCAKFKPDRTHHCRVCRTCVLRMDNHCPWINNCVGFWIHKYFWLFLLYGVLDTSFITCTMAESLTRSISKGSRFMPMLFQMIGVNLAGLLACLFIAYFSFQCWIMLNAFTTIEFCEKFSAPQEEKTGKGKYTSAYNLGYYRNVCAVLGSNPFLWLIPVSSTCGDGLTYERLAKIDSPFGKPTRR